MTGQSRFTRFEKHEPRRGRQTQADFILKLSSMMLTCHHAKRGRKAYQTPALLKCSQTATSTICPQHLHFAFPSSTGRFTDGMSLARVIYAEVSKLLRETMPPFRYTEMRPWPSQTSSTSLIGIFAHGPYLVPHKRVSVSLTKDGHCLETPSSCVP
jgi:hypothetical protein